MFGVNNLETTNAQSLILKILEKLILDYALQTFPIRFHRLQVSISIELIVFGQELVDKDVNCFAVTTRSVL